MPLKKINLSLNPRDHCTIAFFKEDGTISTLNGKPLNIVDQLTYLGSKISSTKNDVRICIGKLWTALDKLSTIWNSDLSDEIKWEFFRAVALSALLYNCTTWTLAKHLGKKA